MSKKNNKQNEKPQGNVVAISRCLAEECSKKDAKAGFCEEHFRWYKEGLVNKHGEKAKDFDIKWQHYLARAS